MILLLIVPGGNAFAGGDLFDDAYRDCPARTRLRDGQIADLTVARDADDEDTVNVAWAATDPATWGLGGNAFRTSLVLLLDDGTEDLHAQSLALGKRTAVFEDVQTGTEATLQMALVVRTPDGDYLISDILEADFHQSLSPPAFRGPVRRGLAQGCELRPTEPAYEPQVSVHQCTFEATRGMVYFIGYSEAFFNYKPAPGHPFATDPATPRLRIGLVHGGEDNDRREDVDFDAYRIRIVDGDGDVLPEADDVATLSSVDRGSPTVMISDSHAHYDETVILLGSSREQNAVSMGRFFNVRVNEGGVIHESIFNVSPPLHDRLGYTGRRGSPGGQDHPYGLSRSDPFSLRQVAANVLHAAYPDEYRDFPIDVLTSDETYTITAWAVNGDDEVVSPVGELRVHPTDRVATWPDDGYDFRNPGPALDNYLSGTNPDVRSVILTSFTILRD